MVSPVICCWLLFWSLNTPGDKFLHFAPLKLHLWSQLLINLLVLMEQLLKVHLLALFAGKSCLIWSQNVRKIQKKGYELNLNNYRASMSNRAASDETISCQLLNYSPTIFITNLFSNFLRRKKSYLNVNISLFLYASNNKLNIFGLGTKQDI